MKFGVVLFPGSNCDDDLMHVIGEVYLQRIKKIWHKETSLVGFNPGDCIFIPGGFSYGDYLRCGAIARFSPIMNDVIRFANEGGLVIGICNGFQILCEAGLLPGQLLANLSHKFICKTVHLKPVSLNTPSATTQPGQQQPVATGPSVQDGKPGKVRANAGAVRGRNPEPAAGDVGRGSAKNAGTDYVPSPRGLTRTAHGSRLPSAMR